jgi:hypothetical protein
LNNKFVETVARDGDNKQKEKLTGGFDASVLYSGVSGIVVAAMGAGAALFVMFFSARKAKKGLNAAS